MKWSLARKACVVVAVSGLALAAIPAKAQQQFINILTGGTTGIYYPIGVTLAKVYGDNIKGVRTQVQATKASVENLNLLEQGRGELALALGDSIKLAWEGDVDSGFKKPLKKLRGIAAIYPNYVQIVAAKSAGIQTLKDLKGKGVSVGAPKSGTEINARSIFEAAGMSYKDLSKTEYLPYAESVELMKNRQIDATLQSAGLGVAALKDLSNSMDVNMVAVPADVVKKVGAPYIPAVIPAGTYKGQDKEVPTAAIVNFLVTHADVSDDMAYQMTKLLWDNLPALRSAHKAAEAIKLEQALQGMPVPLHPGAAKFYKEKGLM